MSTDPTNDQFSLLNMQNSLFLESQLKKPDLLEIRTRFNLDSDEKANSILKFYQDIYFTLNTYSDRFTTDYLKANWTQTGLIKAHHTTEIYTLNNITSIRLKEKIDDQSLSCKEIFDVNPYLEMCTHLDLNIEYDQVLKMFVSAYFNLDEEKDIRDKIKKIMNQNEAFLDGLFNENSKVKFNFLIEEVLEDVATHFNCQDSCRHVLAEQQFLYQNLFVDQHVDSIRDLPGNDELLEYIPEIGSYIKKILDKKSAEQGEDAEEVQSCTFLSHNVLNYNANSIFNVNQLSLFYTYAELNNKYNLLNFLKVRCDPDILLKALEYYFISWGLPNFYVDTPIKMLYENHASDFLEKVQEQNVIDGGLPNIDPEINLKVSKSEFDMQAYTGYGNLSNMRKLISADGHHVEDDDMTFIFYSMLDYKNLKGIELLTKSMKLKSSDTSKPNINIAFDISIILT
jgi:hypothetical protein